ncbi:MAG: anaerobic ribonucleoside-triphosphate reductase activating protein [Halapricum sp.]
MRIADIQPTTLSDFPGRVACTVFTAGCNLRCPYCHNPSLIGGGGRLDEGALWELLDRRRGRLDGVVFTGGEPTLHSDLPAIIQKVSDRGFEVKIDTNGTRPDALAELLATDAIDYVAMDLKARPDRYDELGGRDVAVTVERSVQLIRERAPAFEFRTTWDANIVDPGDFAELAELAGDGPLYVQPVETDDVLDRGAVGETPSEPRKAICAALGTVPSAIQFRTD